MVLGLFLVPVAACEVLCGYGPADNRLLRAEEMVESGELLALTPAELDLALGPHNGRTIAETDRAYFLRKDSSCIDSEWLAVNFGADGRVDSVRIAQD